MISRGTKGFWALYHALSSESRAQARKAFLLFGENPDHPSLRFKKLQGTYLYWSVRFGTGYRAVCRRAGDKADWIWMNPPGFRQNLLADAVPVQRSENAVRDRSK